MAGEYSKFPCWVAASAIGAVFPAAQTIALDSAFTYESSGDAAFLRFVSPVTQASGALTVYVPVTAVTGSPTDVRAAVYNGPQEGDNANRPEAGGTALATSGATDLSSLAGKWATFTISGLSLTVGQTYFLIVENRTGTPGSNYPTIQYAGRYGAQGVNETGWTGGNTTNGFTTNPTVHASVGCWVLKFDDGSLMGNPYAGLETHANNTNDRGSRVRFTEDVEISGFQMPQSHSLLTNLRIYVGSTEQFSSPYALDPSIRNVSRIVRFAPITFEKETDYDVVLDPGASSVAGTSTATMFEATPPTDVQDCRPYGVGFCDGSAPFTPDNTRLMPMCALIASNPAQAAGGGLSAPLVGPSLLVRS